jgi:creatinine amidohydrolase
MLLSLSTWQEVETYLERCTGLIIPIGSTEQHGPNGLIGTDAICPEKVAHGIAEQEGILVAPTLNYGMSQHHMAFAGTVTLRPSTLVQLVIDIVESLSRHGFRHIYFLNGHGGNIAPITTAFSEIYANTGNDSPPRLRLSNWWLNHAVTNLAAELYGEAEGQHATVSEVSLSYFAHPEAVKDVPMSPAVAKNGAFYDAADFRKQFPDGRIGSNPALASIKAGKSFYRLAVKTITDDFRRFVAETDG